MSQQLKAVKDLVEKLVVTSKRFTIPPELQSLIDTLSRTVGSEQPAPVQSSTPSPFPAMTEFDALLLQFQAASDDLSNSEVTSITESALSIFEMMKIILAFSFNAKKPQQSQVQGIAQIISNKCQSIAKNAPNHPQHSKPIVEGLNAVFWVFSDLPKQSIDAAIEPSEFAALKLQQQKIPQLSKWINLYIQSLKALNAWVKANYPTGLSWNFKGEGDFPTLYSQLRGEIPSTLRGGVPAAVVEAPTPVPTVAQATEKPAVPAPAPVVQQQPVAVAAAGPSYPVMTDIENGLKQFQAAALNLDAELQELSNLVLAAFEWMKAIVHFSKDLAKPNQDQLKQIQVILQEKINKPINSSKAGIKYPNHLKTVVQGLSAIIWVLSDMPKTAIDNGIESSEFYGNKVLLMKQPEHSAWNNAFKSILKSLVPYVLANYSTGLLWKYKGSDDYSQLYAVLRGEKSIAPQPAVVQSAPSAPAAPTGPPAIPGPPMIVLPTVTLADLGFSATASNTQSSNSALLDALNVGEDGIKAHLKHVTKGEKYVSNKTADVKKQVVKDIPKEQAKKEPKKYKKDNMFVENFEGERIEIEEGEILQKESLFVDNCNNCTIVVKGKVKSVFANKCKKLNLLVTNAISGIEIVGCNSSQLYVMNSVPSVQVDNSDTIRITFMKERACDVVSSKTCGLNVTYALNEDGDFEKDTPIPEQFITKWDPVSNSFKTKILDTFL